MLNTPKEMPIKKKLILVIFLTSFAVLVLENIGFIIYEHLHHKNELTQDIDSFARIISKRSSEPLSQRDKKVVQDILEIVSIEKQIVAACIYDEKGQIFTRFESGEESPFKFPDDVNLLPVAEIENGYLQLSEPIMREGVQLGTVFIRASLQESNLRWYNFLLYRGLMTMIFSIITLLVTLRLQRVVLRPIERLNAMIHTIVVNQNYRMRVKVESNDEIGSLAHAFNRTLEAMESRESALHRCHERLANFEQKVDYPADLLALASFHIAEGIELNGGQVGAYRKQLFRFRKHFANATNELRCILLDEKDELSAITYCNALKGVSGNIGAMSLLGFTAHLSNSLCEGKQLDENDFNHLDKLLTDVFHDIDSLHVEPAESPMKRGVSPMQLASVTKDLLTIIEQDLGASEKLLTQLCDLAKDSEFEDLAEAISVQVDEFNVEQATFLLIDLQQRLLSQF
jgi:HAMP domain-containing protein